MKNNTATFDDVPRRRRCRRSPPLDGAAGGFTAIGFDGGSGLGCTLPAGPERPPGLNAAVGGLAGTSAGFGGTGLSNGVSDGCGGAGAGSGAAAADLGAAAGCTAVGAAGAGPGAAAVNSCLHNGQTTRLPTDFSAMPMSFRHEGQVVMIAIRTSSSPSPYNLYRVPGRKSRKKVAKPGRDPIP